MSGIHKLTKNERLILRALGDRGGFQSAIRLRTATQLSVSEFVNAIHQASDRNLIQITGNRISITARGATAFTLPSKRNITDSTSPENKRAYLSNVRTARLPPNALYTPNMELALQGLRKLAKLRKLARLF